MGKSEEWQENSAWWVVMEALTNTQLQHNQFSI